MIGLRGAVQSLKTFQFEAQCFGSFMTWRIALLDVDESLIVTVSVPGYLCKQ